MSYIENNLISDEIIIFRTRKSLIIFIAPLLLLFVTLLFCCNFDIFIKMNAVFEQVTAQLPFLHYISKLPAAIMLCFTLYSAIRQWLVWLTSDYAVTNKRVIVREGIADRYVCDIRLTTISQILVDQNWLAQLFNYGTITLNNFGGNQDRLVGVNSPNQFKNSVQAQLNTSSL